MNSMLNSFTIICVTSRKSFISYFGRVSDLAFKKNRPYVIAGLFNDKDEEIQRTFTSAIKMVNKERHENEELSNTYFAQEMPDIKTDPFYATSKGKKILNVT